MNQCLTKAWVRTHEVRFSSGTWSLNHRNGQSLCTCKSRKYPYLPPWKGFFWDSHPLWKFQLSSIHFFNFFGLTDTPIARKFQSLLMGEYGYFLELHIICSYCKLIKYLDVKQINISLLCVFENFISCNKSNLFPLLANLNKKNKNHCEWLSDYIFLHCLFWSLIHYT